MTEKKIDSIAELDFENDINWPSTASPNKELTVALSDLSFRYKRILNLDSSLILDDICYRYSNIRAFQLNNNIDSFQVLHNQTYQYGQKGDYIYLIENGEIGLIVQSVFEKIFEPYLLPLTVTDNELFDLQIKALEDKSYYETDCGAEYFFTVNCFIQGILSYEWELTKPDSSTIKFYEKDVHYFASLTGGYSLNLKVTDENNLQYIASQTTFTVNKNPVVKIQAQKLYPAEQQKITFFADVRSAATPDYKWELINLTTREKIETPNEEFTFTFEDDLNAKFQLSLTITDNTLTAIDQILFQIFPFTDYLYTSKEFEVAQQSDYSQIGTQIVQYFLTKEAFDRCCKNENLDRKQLIVFQKICGKLIEHQQYFLDWVIKTIPSSLQAKYQRKIFPYLEETIITLKDSKHAVIVFKITDQSLRRLDHYDLPEKLIMQFNIIKDDPFVTKTIFLEAIEKIIYDINPEKGKFEQYKQLIFQVAHKFQALIPVADFNVFYKVKTDSSRKMLSTKDISYSQLKDGKIFLDGIISYARTPHFVLPIEGYEWKIINNQTFTATLDSEKGIMGITNWPEGDEEETNLNGISPEFGIKNLQTPIESVLMIYKSENQINLNIAHWQFKFKNEFVEQDPDKLGNNFYTFKLTESEITFHVFNKKQPDLNFKINIIKIISDNSISYLCKIFEVSFCSSDNYAMQTNFIASDTTDCIMYTFALRVYDENTVKSEWLQKSIRVWPEPTAIIDVIINSYRISLDEYLGQLSQLNTYSFPIGTVFKLSGNSSRGANINGQKAFSYEWKIYVNNEYKTYNQSEILLDLPVGTTTYTEISLTITDRFSASNKISASNLSFTIRQPMKAVINYFKDQQQTDSSSFYVGTQILLDASQSEIANIPAEAQVFYNWKVTKVQDLLDYDDMQPVSEVLQKTWKSTEYVAVSKYEVATGKIQTVIVQPKTMFPIPESIEA